MPDKLTDNLSNNSPILANELSDSEIKKALECCSKKICKQCPNFSEDIECSEKLITLALDLINRQDFKIHQLEKQVSEIQNANLIDFKGTIANYKAENESLKAEIERKDKIYIDLLKTSGERAEIIGKQNIEIERLKQITGFTPARGSGKSPFLNVVLDNVRAEAYEAFAKRLTEEIVNDIHFSQIEKDYLCVMIDNLLKELVGDK